MSFLWDSVGLFQALANLAVDLTSLSRLLSVSASSAVFIHVYFSQRLCSITQRAHLPQTVWFSETNEGRLCVLLLYFRCRFVLARTCFSSAHWSGTRTAELVTSGTSLSAEAAQWWTPEWWVFFLWGEPEQSSAGECSVWPGLLWLDNKQIQQFSRVSHVSDRRGFKHEGGKKDNFGVCWKKQSAMLVCVCCVS